MSDCLETKLGEIVNYHGKPHAVMTQITEDGAKSRIYDEDELSNVVEEILDGTRPDPTGDTLTVARAAMEKMQGISDPSALKSFSDIGGVRQYLGGVDDQLQCGVVEPARLPQCGTAWAEPDAVPGVSCRMEP